MLKPRICAVLLLTSTILAHSSHAAELGKARADLQIARTDSGIRFGILGSKPAQPAPTIIVLALSIEETLTETYLRAGNELMRQGFLVVSIDLACHGQWRGAGEPVGLEGWKARLDKGEPFVEQTTDRLSKVLDHLIERGYSDPWRIAACGTSRGAFAALHFAAHDRRVRCVAAYSPVTDLLVLREFASAGPRTQPLALERQAALLAGRPVWIMIGDNDQRVSTDKAIAFARTLSHAAYARKIPSGVELHVMPTATHRPPPEANRLSAAWILKHLAK